MLSEEHEILRSTIREYVQKSIEPEALDIERKGISADLRKSISAQGFLGAVIKAELGGSELDETGYTILLDEIARASPSVAADILLLNSFFYPLASRSDDGSAVLKDVLSSGKGSTVVLNDILEGYKPEGEISASSNGLSGTRTGIPNRNAEVAILLTEDDQLILLDERSSFGQAEYSFGFRGLGLSTLTMKDLKFRTILPKGGRDALEEVMEKSDLAISAIALGMVSGCLQKGLDYTKVRKTFGQSLSDYQPVAFTISSLKAEEEILRNFLYSENLGEKERLMLKIRSLELARRASKYALQVHGGYGYFEDFGVEKFYRDSTALSSMFSRTVKDLERLSKYVYEERAGFL